MLTTYLPYYFSAARSKRHQAWRQLSGEIQKRGTRCINFIYIGNHANFHNAPFLIKLLYKLMFHKILTVYLSGKQINIDSRILFVIHVVVTFASKALCWRQNFDLSLDSYRSGRNFGRICDKSKHLRRLRFH